MGWGVEGGGVEGWGAEGLGLESLARDVKLVEDAEGRSEELPHGELRK